MQYREGYVDPFAALLAKYKTVPVAIVMEPDSLGKASHKGERERKTDTRPQSPLSWSPTRKA